ncbi:MAG TPA: C40 family peptidase [Elusimicrobiota bacterium]|jgi:cell wall-associated NlpC family hydrolase|nr:C40 family peptidase [Elusimicrobiota bacterium]
MARGSAARAALLLSAFLAGCAGAPRRAAHPPDSVEGKAVIRVARSYLPEEGSRPVPEDCSDFVRKVFGERKHPLPRSAVTMAALGTPVKSSRELAMGDLLFFTGSSGKGVGHVAIYVHNGIFIHLSKKSEGVRMESLYSDYYRKHYLFARRVL